MMTAYLLLILAIASGPVDRNGAPALPPRSSRGGAIESRPLWDRPAMGLSLQAQAESALDRGNGRIEDEPTFDLKQIARDNTSRFDLLDTRASFEDFQRQWDRQHQVERAEQKAEAQQKRQRKTEIESEALAAERERWLRQSLQPRHEEAAIIDRQGLEQADRQYESSVQTAGAIRDSAIKTIDANAKLPEAEKSAQRALVNERYQQRMRSAELSRQQRRAMILGEER